jgi:hypothetical protein
MLPDMSKPLSFIPGMVLILAFAACACGGAVDTNQTPGRDTAPSNGSGSSGGAGCCGDSSGQSLLGDCKPGFSADQETTAKPCRFFVGKTCYSTQDEACACVCPRDKGPVICVADGNQYLAGTDAYGVWCEPE